MPSSHNNRHQLDCMSDDDEFAYASRNKSEQNNNSKMGRKKKNPQQSLQSELSGLPPTPSEDKVKAGVRFSKQRAQKNASRSAPQTQRNSKTAQNASRSRKPSRNDSNDERGLESLDDPHNSPSFMANAAAKVSSMASNTLNFINDKQKQHKKRRIENSKGGGVLGDIGCETLKFSKTPKLSNQSAKHHEAQRNDQSHQAENALNFADNFQNSSPARKSPNNNNNRQGRDWHQSKNSSNNNHNSNNHHNQKSDEPAILAASQRATTQATMQEVCAMKIKESELTQTLITQQIEREKLQIEQEKRRSEEDTARHTLELQILQKQLVSLECEYIM